MWRWGGRIHTLSELKLRLTTSGLKIKQTAVIGLGAAWPWIQDHDSPDAGINEETWGLSG